MNHDNVHELEVPAEIVERVIGATLALAATWPDAEREAFEAVVRSLPPTLAVSTAPDGSDMIAAAWADGTDPVSALLRLDRLDVMLTPDGRIVAL